MSRIGPYMQVPPEEDWFSFPIFRELTKLKTLDEIKNISEEMRKNYTVVTTNGAFDILHPGHIATLLQARAMGDLLIVGLNTDESIKSYKSTERPYQTLEERMAIIASLECVNYVTSFSETTPHAFLRAVKPHVHVKSKSGYTGAEEPILKEWNGRLELLGDLEGYSTTRIINKIKGRSE